MEDNFSIQKLYNEWLKTDKSVSFIQYYNLHNQQYWDRNNKQRNYKRNHDIVISSNRDYRNDKRVKYQLLGILGGEFYFDDKTLKYRYDEDGYNSHTEIDYIRPYSYITMNVDDELNLLADIPMLVNDVDFIIDNGYLIIETNE